MTTILPQARSPWHVIDQAIGQQLSQNLPGAVAQGYNRGQLQNNLSQLKSLAQSGASPLEVTLAAMQAGAGIPGSERYLGELIPMLQKISTANAAQKVPFGQGDVSQSRPQEPMGQMSQQQAPNIPNAPNQQTQNFPTNIGPQNAPGNLPQAATTGQVVPLRNPKEQRAAAVQRAKESTDEGIPITPKEALSDIQKEEEDKKLHNAQVEKERQQRVVSQEEYGNKAVSELKKIYPESTPEMDAIFQKKGEEAARRGESEADINKYLAVEARNFKNAINNVKNDLSAPRTQNQFQRKFLGSDKDFNQAAADLRVKLKPLLNQGLYDTSRKLLTDLGYYPEEREQIINPLSERLNTMMNKVPKAQRTIQPEGALAGRTPSFNAPISYGPNDIENIKDGLIDLKKSDPNFSLVLARKAFEDKGYDWRIFKDALNDLEKNGFKLEDDQQIQRTYLDTPPLNTIERVLHGLNLMGR